MSKVTTKINRIKKKLDSISGLEGDFVVSSINGLDAFVDILINEIELHLKENKKNGTIFDRK